MADLVARALDLSVTWWLTYTALVVLTGAMVLAWLARWGSEWDRERGG